jgi:soluble lytic murein transglycosylase-like protein
MRRLGLLFLLAANLAVGGEYAVFASGARLHVDRHEADGAKVRLYHDGGFVEMDQASVKAYEKDELTPAAPPVAAQSAPAAPEQPKALNPAELADAAADKYGLPRSLVRSVMAAESGSQSQAVSPKGAIGLMQLMPGTAQELGADPYDPAQNVDAGTRYLRSLLERYNGALWHALAAYNAGAGAVEKYHGVPPYRETINYIGRIQRKMDSSESNR